MQDKEFDELFRSKLDDFSTEPSAQVWHNIDAELGGKRKSILPLLRIAASIVLLLAAGVLFITRKEKDDVTKPGKNNVAHIQPVSPKVKTPPAAPVSDAPPVKNRKTGIPANSLAGVHHPKKLITSPAKQIKPVAPVIQTAPVKDDDQQLIAAVEEPKKTGMIQHSVPDMAIALTQPAINDAPIAGAVPLQDDQPALAQAKVPATTPANRVKKHGIHNFGDLVNLVVAKVDKRKDKLIEFTDTDDDESTITGVHLGAINIKKDNK